eukprot:349845-Amphidinium_carterae.2
MQPVYTNPTKVGHGSIQTQCESLHLHPFGSRWRKTQLMILHSKNKGSNEAYMQHPSKSHD